jgi:hypothetical protein
MAKKGEHLSVETKKRLSESRLGLKWTEEQKTRFSLIAKEHNFGGWMKGKKLSEEHKKNISDGLKKEITWIVADNNCWECTSHSLSHNGYPRIGNKHISRIIYEKYNGIIPEGMVIRHICDNPLCINPEHLLIGTPKENIYDCIERGRNAKGEKQGSHKLSDNQIREIIMSKEKASDLASKYKVTKGNIYVIKKRKSWKHI